MLALESVRHGRVASDDAERVFVLQVRLDKRLVLVHVSGFHPERVDPRIVHPRVQCREMPEGQQVEREERRF